jgi:hypothetical protein
MLKALINAFTPATHVSDYNRGTSGQAAMYDSPAYRTPPTGDLATIIKPAVPRPTPALVTLTDGEMEKLVAYRKTADALGFRPAQLILNEIYAFMADAGIEVFELRKVRSYLTANKPKGVDHWCWRPLRADDAIKKYTWDLDDDGRPENDGYYSSSLWECRPYESLVPAHALEKVARIQARFGKDVKFFVSDFAKPDTDPFIMCRPAPCDSGDGGRPYEIVFDVWDEPGFGK